MPQKNDKRGAKSSILRPASIPGQGARKETGENYKDGFREVNEMGRQLHSLDKAEQQQAKQEHCTESKWKYHRKRDSEKKNSFVLTPHCWNTLIIAHSEEKENL